MFDLNIKEFIKDIGLDNLESFLENTCDDFDTYDRHYKKAFNRSKQLYYNSNEIDLEHLRMICKVSKGECLGVKFKDKLYQGRCEDFLESVNADY